jgi:hypothetical protein
MFKGRWKNLELGDVNIQVSSPQSCLNYGNAKHKYFPRKWKLQIILS